MRILCLAAVVLAAGGLCGCFAGVVAAGAAGGLAAAKIAGNQVTRDYPVPLRTAYEATLSALPALGYPAPKASTLGPSEARVEAGDAAVAMATFPGGTTRVAVRVGTFESADHERRAALIHERLAARLGPAPVPAPP
jgi:hypothetical protein